MGCQRLLKATVAHAPDAKETVQATAQQGRFRTGLTVRRLCGRKLVQRLRIQVDDPDIGSLLFAKHIHCVQAAVELCRHAVSHRPAPRRLHVVQIGFNLLHGLRIGEPGQRAFLPRQEVQVIVRILNLQRFDLRRPLLQLLPGKGVDRVVHGIAVVASLGQQRLVEQVLQERHRCAGHVFGGGALKRAGKDGQPGQQQLPFGREQAPGTLEDGAQRALVARQVARVGRQKVQALGEFAGQRAAAQQRQHAGRQLDPERQAVDQPADLPDRGQGGGVDGKGGVELAGALRKHGDGFARLPDAVGDGSAWGRPRPAATGWRAPAPSPRAR